MNKIVASLFVCLIVFSGNLISQSISFQPSTISVEPCKDSISIQMSLIGNPADSISVLTFPLSDKWEYMDQTASISGNAQIDSVVIGNFLEIYLSEVTTASQLTIDLKTTCEAIDATNYNFYQAAEYSRLMTNGSFSFSTDSLYFTVNSPFLVLSPKVYANNPSVGDTIVRKTIIENTGSLPFSGAFSFSFNSQKYAEIVGTSVYATNGLQLYFTNDNDSSGSSKGQLFNFSPSDSLIFTDTVIIRSCDIDSTKTFYNFDYGCDTLNLCKTIGIEPFIYSNIQDLPAWFEIYINNLDRGCFLDQDTTKVVRGIRNKGTETARNYKFFVYNIASYSSRLSNYIPNGHYTFTLNGNLVVPDSIGYDYKFNDCGQDSVVRYLSITIPEFKPEDSLLVEYEVVTCCENKSYGYYHYAFQSMSDRTCSDGVFHYGTFRTGKSFKMEQFFENLTATIQIAPGDTDRTSNPVDFSIENVNASFTDQVHPDSLNGPIYQLLGNDTNAVIQVKLLLDTGLKYVDSTMYMQTLPNAAFQETLVPYKVEKVLGLNSRYGQGGKQDTIYAYFSLPEYFYNKVKKYSSWHYDSLERFFSDSKIYFQLQGICPAKQPVAKISEVISLIRDTTCTNSCAVQLTASDEEVAVMCPGCVTPGYIMTSFSLNRSTIGIRDDDNNFFPDSIGLDNQGQTIIGSDIPATESLIHKKRAMFGDTLDLEINAHLWEGGITVSSLGFAMKNTIVQFLLADPLELVGDITCIYHDVSKSAIDTIYIPLNYLKNNGTLLDFHIDSLKAHNIDYDNTYDLDYFGGDDYFRVLAKTRVVKNIGVAQDAISSFGRVIASGRIYAERAGVLPDAPERYPTGMPLTDSVNYFCEFQGDKTSFVRVRASSYTGSQSNWKFLTKQFRSLYTNIVNESQYVQFLNFRNPIVIGKEFDDSFPYEVRQFVEFDSVIIEKPLGYEMTSYRLYSSASSHDGALSQYYSFVDTVYNPPLDISTNSYITFPESHFTDTTALPVYNDPINPSNRSIYRDSLIFNTDEETHPKVYYEMTPTICSDVIGKRIPFAFRGGLKSYPMHDGKIVISDTLEAYLPLMKLTTMFTSPDTSYLTDSVNVSSFRILREMDRQPYTDSSTMQSRYDMDAFQSVFARVLTSPLVENVSIKRSNSNIIMEYDSVLNLFVLSQITRSAPSKEYDLAYTYSCPSGTNNILDSIVLITGWNCDGLPTDLSHACQLDTNVFYIVPEEAGLDIEYTVADSNLFCNPQTHTVILNSQGSGDMINITTKVDLSNTVKTYSPNSGRLEFPAGVLTPFEPDSNLIWHFNDIPHFANNGFVFLDGTAKLHFDLDGWSQSPDETISLFAVGETYCGDSISFNFEKDFKKVGLYGAFRKADSVPSCDTVPYTLCLNSLDTGIIRNMTASLDLTNTGYLYLANSASIEFPKGTFTSIEPTNLVWYFDTIAYLKQNGFADADSTLKLHFSLVYIDPPLVDSISINVIGVTDCADSIFIKYQNLIPELFGGDPAIDLISAEIIGNFCTYGEYTTFYNNEGFLDTLNIKYQLDSNVIGSDSVVLLFTNTDSRLDTSYSNIRDIGNEQHEYVLYPPYQIGSIINLKLALAGISASNNGFCFEIIDIKGLVYDGNYCYQNVSDVVHDSIQVLRGTDNESINMISYTSCETSDGNTRIVAQFQNPTPRDRAFVFRVVTGSSSSAQYNWQPNTIVDSIGGNNSETVEVVFTLPSYITFPHHSIEVIPQTMPCDCIVGYYQVPQNGPCDDFVIAENPLRKSYSNAKNHNHYSIEKLGINTVIAGTLFDSTSLTSTNTHVQLLSPNGNIIWEKEFDFGAEDERCFDVEVNSDNEILLTGYQQDDAQSKRKLFVAKLDELGVLIAAKSFDHENDWNATGFDVLAPANTEDYFITGYSSEELLEKGSMKQAILLKINSDLDLIWYKELEDAEGEYNVGNDLEEVGDQYVFVTGSTGSSNKNQNLLAVLYDFSGNQIWNLSANTKKGEDLVGADAVYKEDGDQLFILANSDKDETFEIYLIKDASKSSAFNGGVMSSDLASFWKETAGYSLEMKPNTNSLWVAGLAKTMKKDGQFSNNSPTFIAQVDFDKNRFDWVKYMENGNHDYYKHDHAVFEAFNGANALYNYPDIMVVPNELNVQMLDYESDGRYYRVGVTQLDHSGGSSNILDCQVEESPDPISKSYVNISLTEEDLGGDNQEIVTSPVNIGHVLFSSCPTITDCYEYLHAAYSFQDLGNNLFKLNTVLISDEGDSVDVHIDWGDGNDTMYRVSSSTQDFFINHINYQFNKYDACDTVTIVYTTAAANGKPCRYEYIVPYSVIGVECGVLNPHYVKTYGNGEDHNHYSIEANAGGLYMAGTIYPKNELGNTNIHVQKTDVTGAILWEKIYDLGTTERCMNMTLTEENIVLTGGLQNASGDWEVIMMKLSQQDGSIMDEAVLQTGSAFTNQVGVSVIYSEGVGKFFVVARVGDGSANPQSVLICTDNAFNYLWSKRIAPTWQGARELKAIEVIELANQEVLVLGHVGIQANGFAIKFDDSGNEEWQFCNMNYGATYSGVYDAQHDKVYLVSGDHSMRITTIDNVSTPNYTVTEKLFGLGASSTTAPNAISDFSMYNSIRDVALSEDEQRLLIYGASGNKGSEHTALITVQRANLTLLDISIFESGHSGSVVRRHFEHDSLLNSDMSSDSDVLTENSSNGMVRYGNKAYIIAYNNIVGSQDVQDEYNLYLHSYSDYGLKYLNCESSYSPSTPPTNVTVGSCDLDLLDENYTTVSINSTELGGNHNLVNDCVQIPRLKSPYANKNDGLDSQIENLSEFSIYPNPTEGNLTVSFGEDKEKVGVRIFSTGGKVVLELQLYKTRKEQLDVSDFAKGMYFVELNIDGETYREKLIVQ